MQIDVINQKQLQPPPPNHVQKNKKIYTAYTGEGKSRFTVVRMEKDMQIMIITIAVLTQKNVTMARCTIINK
jgi:hypothetical protein